MEQTKKMGIFDNLVIGLFKPNLNKKTNFFRLLATSQKAGLGVRDALMAIRKSENNRGMQFVIDDLISQLTKGVNLGTAMESHDFLFRKDETALIKSSELMGNLPQTLEEIAKENENMQIIKNKIKKAITYPIILVIFTVIAVTILLLHVVPTIISMFPTTEGLPFITRFMLNISSFMQYAWFPILILIFLVSTCVYLLHKYFLPFKILVDGLFISMPLVGPIVKTFYMYRFSKLLGQFYNSGLSSIVGLSLMKDIFQNFYYQKKSLEIKEDLESGFSFAEAMDGSILFDPILVQIIFVGEETGNIAEVLLKMSDYYRDLLDTKIAILMALIEPFLLAVMAIVIGMVIGSIFLPMAELVNVIQ